MHIESEQFKSMHLGVYMYMHIPLNVPAAGREPKGLHCHQTHLSHLSRKTLALCMSSPHSQHSPLGPFLRDGLLTCIASASTAHGHKRVRAGCRRLQHVCELRGINIRILISDRLKWRKQPSQRTAVKTGALSPGFCFSAVAVKARAQVLLG